MIRLLLVDDQALVRQGLRKIVETAAEMAVVAECADGDEVVDALTRHTVDVVVMDVRMKRLDGAAATAQVRRAGGPPVLVLTTFDDDETIAAALHAGAAGFVLKDAPGEEIIRAIRRVAEGDAWLDPAVTARVLAGYRTARAAKAVPELRRLTARERDVLHVVGRGATNDEVAQQLFISQATVKTHLGSVLAKLGLRDRSAAIVFVHEHGLLGDS
ncbi:MAG: response regulator transcription factor [Jiangellales bacterium]